MTGGRGTPLGRAAFRVVVCALLLASLLPVANWIVSERSVPWYPRLLEAWGLGLLWVLGGAAILAVASGRVPSLWREGSLSEALGRLDPANSRALWLVAGLALLAYLGVATAVFDRRPLLIDEVVQLWQARTYASGRLWLPVDADPAFRSALNLVEFHGRWFGHFPPGWPLLLALGELVRAPWLVGPVAGAVAVLCFGLILRRAEREPSVRAGALLLFAFAPFTLSMASSHMSHGPVLMWLLAALAAWLRWLEQPDLPLALLVGGALGMAAITRPADAAAFGFPLVIWVLLRLRGGDPWTRFVPMVAAAFVPLGFMLAVNLATTGSLLTSGYALLWGPNVGLGFHPAPYGPAHTPLRGLELVSLYLFRLNTYLFEAPVPGLLGAGTALLLARRFGAVDRYLLAAGGTLLAVYFAYWHDGFFLGPRFVYPLVPLLALWTARLPRLVAERAPGFGHRASAYAVSLAVAGAIASGIPARQGANAAVELGMRFDADRAAAEHGIRDAIILVRESWGAQLLARMWALGIAKPDVERLYHNIDSCVLDAALQEAERLGGTAVNPAVFGSLMGDSAKLVRSPFSPDSSERVLDGAHYTPWCAARINEDREGYTLLAPTLLSRRPDLLFVRDLPGRNSRVLTSRPNASVYLLTRRPGVASAEFRLVNRDSVAAVPPGPGSR